MSQTKAMGRYFERVENINDLGVTFDNRLDFQAHIHE